LAAPSPLGLPVYSASGFDLLSILARVATRPHPRVVLGPVDLTCSFVVVDVRRHDQPIVYCSPSFCRLTGYEENEILGRNCRFLQAPGGLVHKGDVRTLTSHEAVVHLKKSLTADKECQTSIVNYRKDGTAFINLVTVIPILGGVGGGVGEEAEVVYHVGFQVDLTEQPNAILEKLRDGSYLVDYSNQGVVSGFGAMAGMMQHGGRERKTNAIPQPKMAKELRKMLANSRFLRSIPITTSTTVPTPLSSASTSTTASGASAEEGPSANGGNQPLHLLLLEASPDFVHVVSLKGSFLYVAPSVRRVLGYEPEEMVGKSIADFTHPEDVVPLMRELKESSATGMSATGGEGGQAVGGPMQAAPRTVDLLFRARTREGAYVWVECCGRLHVEPGKGRKAIVLSGRAKEMPRMSWEAVGMAGGLARSVKMPSGEESQGEVAEVEREFWGTMSGEGKGRGMLTFLSVGAGVRDVLGWTAQELVGRGVAGIVLDAGLEEEVARISRSNDPRKVHCRMRRKDGSAAEVVLVLYRPIHDPLVRQSTKVMESISPAPLIYQVKLADASSMPTTSHHTTIPAQLTNSPTANIFEELEISRGSSWQYELEKLKFTNQRLMDEIAALE
ncbi:PAS domain-containing protein, partial [Crucibulum laeve]